MEVMARYGGGGGPADVAWKVGRIMLKYRPIAPKPLSGASLPAGPIDTKSGAGRGKRKAGAAAAAACLKDGSRRGRKSTKRSASSAAAAPAAATVVDPGAFREETAITMPPCPVVTLPLMPVTPERKEESPPATPSPTASDGHVAVSYFGNPSWRQQQQQHHVGTTCNNNNNNGGSCSSSSGSGSSSVVVAPRPVRPVGSWVTVECVTDAWQEGEQPAGGRLEVDACPVLVSDPYDRVTWTNAAYKRMVVGPGDAADDDDDEEEEVMRVALVTRGLVPADPGVTCFTCRVRVRYACRRRGKVSMAVPCDVWRMADGSLAWRLDLKAALSLSLGS